MKASTAALNVEYIAVVPLISPLVDGTDQQALAVMSKFLPGYYKTSDHTYYYPFVSTAGENYDYIDYAYLEGKNAILAGK